MDESKECVSCKFDMTQNKFACLKVVCQSNPELSILCKPKFCHIPTLCRKVDKTKRQNFLSALEHFYFCPEGCTSLPFKDTQLCKQNHKKVWKISNGKFYQVYQLRKRYFRLKNGMLWLNAQPENP